MKPLFLILSLFSVMVLSSAFTTVAGVSVTAQPFHVEQMTDTDDDGFPDAAELLDETDRNHFRRWFIAIAQSQFYHIHPQWPEIRHDCTGLICFAYKEALKIHDKEWFKHFKYLTDITIPDVKAYHYPEVPIIGEMVFRGQDGDFLPIVTAPILMQYNCQYLGKECDETIQDGDLLFFRYRHEDDIDDVYHAMILIKKPGEYPRSPSGEVVYHTGPDRLSSGEVRKVTIATLNLHPDDTWHIKPDNPHFLGFFRFNILHYQRRSTSE